MAKNHDRAARLIAKKVGAEYDSKRSPDIRGKERRVEIKTTTAEITKAIKQLGGGQSKKKYVSLPKREHEKAREKLAGSGIGLMDHKGKTTKQPRRKKKIVATNLGNV